LIRYFDSGNVCDENGRLFAQRVLLVQVQVLTPLVEDMYVVLPDAQVKQFEAVSSNRQVEQVVSHFATMLAVVML